jgi:hypothetical protein
MRISPLTLQTGAISLLVSFFSLHLLSPSLLFQGLARLLARRLLGGSVRHGVLQSVAVVRQSVGVSRGRVLERQEVHPGVRSPR